MDSNFQVRISANIQDLQRSIKEAQATLAQFKQSADGAAAATKKMEAEANRGRLVAFAFGQVLRDAGFFAQDFRLGILAISNNIPILIDQLVLLSNVSKGVGAAISLLGSLLTAGLTIWAYTASGVDNFTKSLKEYKTAVNESRASAETEVVTLKALLSVANDNTLSLGQRQDAINRINSGYKEYNNELTLNNVNSQKNISTTDRLTQSLVLQAKASAEAAYYTKLQAQMYEIQDKPLSEQVSLFEKVGIVLASTVKKNDDLNRSIMNLDFKGLVDTYKGLFEIRGMQNFADAFNKISPAMDDSKKRLEDFVLQLTKLKIAGTKTTSPLADLAEKLKLINSDISLTPAEQAQKRAEAYKETIQDLIKSGIDPASASLQRLQSIMATSFGAAGAMDFVQSLDILRSIKESQDKIGLRTKGTEQKPFRQGAVRPVDITGDYMRQFTDMQLFISDMIPTVGQIIQGVVSQVANGFADIISTFADGLGQLLSGDMSISQFGQTLVQSISKFLSQIGKQMIAFGAATIAYGVAMKAIKSGNPAAMITGGAGLIAAGAALTAIGAAISGMVGGGESSSSSSASPTPTFGSLTPRPAASPTSTTAMAVNSLAGGGVLETRVSGNDLVILMDRASKNRGEYF